jgi:glycosyltransferase involved in cell wall biosynthesis
MARARELGIAVVCDSGTTHIDYWDDTISEEHSRWAIPYKPIHPSIKASILGEYELADVITVPSTYVRRTFLQKGTRNSRIEVIPYGVDLSLFRPCPKRDDVFRILFVGSLCLHKGLPYLLEAASRLRLPGSELVLIGPSMRETEVVLSRTDARFRCLGRVPQADLYRHYSQASVFVLPSVADGFGLVLAQAMACGVPVIATENTGAEDLFTEGVEGFVVRARDVDALCEKILYLHENPDHREAMGLAGLQRVRSLGGWDTYGRKAIEMFGELIEAKRSAERGVHRDDQST